MLDFLMNSCMLHFLSDPFHEDKSGNSALHLACMFSELRTTEALIKGAYEK